MVPTGQVLSQTSSPIIIRLHIYPLTPFHVADKNPELPPVKWLAVTRLSK